MKSGRHVEVFDPEFKYVKEVPSTVVRHLPPARLNITRLVFCRNYVPGELGSCSMGDGCKFVHADVDPDSLESHPIHVKYAWRHEDVCTYARLPAGETLRVLSLSDRAVLEEFASERVLVTRGSLRYRTEGATLSQCVHYNQHRMCNRGERCNFVHTVFVDPNAKGNFKRAPLNKTDGLPVADAFCSSSDTRSPVEANAQGVENVGDSVPWKAVNAFLEVPDGGAPSELPDGWMQSSLHSAGNRSFAWGLEDSGRASSTNNVQRNSVDDGGTGATRRQGQDPSEGAHKASPSSLNAHKATDWSWFHHNPYDRQTWRKVSHSAEL